MKRAALGVRVKSGWGSAVLVGATRDAPQFLHRARILLSDPDEPKSSQPYHRGFGSLQTDAAILKRLSNIVYAATLRSLSSLIQECEGLGRAPQTVAIVVGSTIDPELVTNEHIRAHACEAQLFRSALERAATQLRLPYSVTRERDLRGIAAATLRPGAPALVADLGEVAGRPWRADEKLATLAAWVALAQPRRRAPCAREEQAEGGEITPQPFLS